MLVVKQIEKLTSDKHQQIANKMLAPGCSDGAERKRPADMKTTLMERDNAVQLIGLCWENDTYEPLQIKDFSSREELGIESTKAKCQCQFSAK